MRDPFRTADPLTRREAMALAARSLLGVSLLPLLGRLAGEDQPAPVAAVPPAAATARNVIYLAMSGGMSHLDTFDPKDDAEVMGATKVIPTSVDGIRLGEHLPGLAQQMHRCALVRSLNSTQGAHEQGQYYVRTGYTLRGTIRHPGLGAWLAFLGGRGNPTLPGNVLIGGDSRHPGAGFLDGRFAPLPLGNAEAGLQHAGATVDDAHFQRRRDLLTRIDSHAPNALSQATAYRDLYDEAVQLMHSKDLAAFDISQEPAAVRESYGNDRFAQGCLLARRLVERDVRFVEVNLGGWDTHDDHFTRIEERCAILDSAVSALLDDLATRGLLDHTLVVLGSEFGRTPKINQNNGRDHHPKCFTALLAGGGIRGGRVHGASDERGYEPAKDPVSIPDFNATIAHALGLSLDQVTKAANGRPFTVADHGKPLTSLFT